MKKKMFIIVGLTVLFLIVFAGLVCLPYRKQGDVSKERKAQFSVRNFYGETTGKERAAILYENEEALAERIRLIAHAKERIILSTFDFRVDNSGKQMLAALYDAASRGVNVQLVVDGFSYFNNMQGNEYFYTLGCLENVEIKVYNPVNLLKPWKLMGRLHDKYLIADETAYILGGRNTFDYFLGNETDYKNYDWDALVYCADAGEHSSMEQLVFYFQSVWNLKECKPVMEKEASFAGGQKKLRAAEEELEMLYQEMQAEHKEWFAEIDYMKYTVGTNQIRLMSNPVQTAVKEPTVFYEMTELMQQSQGDIVFHTPYILCNDYMLERLGKICDSGKQVTMMTNSVANNGNPFGAVDYQIHKGDILNTGVQVLEYDKGVSYHGKCFTIGDRLTGIGSFNWDMRSAYLDTELMLVIDSKQLNQQMREDMETYEKDALVVEDEENYLLKEGQKPREISKKRAMRIRLLKPLDKTFRYLF